MFDLIAHLKRQIAFSRGTFGPGERRDGVIDHIRKELDEIKAGNGDPKEWVDIVILGFDGLWRSLHAGTSDDGYRLDWEDIPHTMTALLEAKHAKNEQRDWPDWRAADPNKAIEHVRGGEHD